MIHPDYLRAQLQQRKAHYAQLRERIQAGKQAEIEAINLEGQMQALESLLDTEEAVPIESILPEGAEIVS